MSVELFILLLLLLSMKLNKYLALISKPCCCFPDIHGRFRPSQSAESSPFPSISFFVQSFAAVVYSIAPWSYVSWCTSTYYGQSTVSDLKCPTNASQSTTIPKTRNSSKWRFSDGKWQRRYSRWQRNSASKWTS